MSKSRIILFFFGLLLVLNFLFVPGTALAATDAAASLKVRKELVKKKAELEEAKAMMGGAAAISVKVSNPATDKSDLDYAIADVQAQIDKLDRDNRWDAKYQASRLKDWAWNDFILNTVNQGGAKALDAAVRSALNTIAYDTATWLGSGGKGQKPLFYTEGWGEYLANIGDNAAGTFIEQLGKEGTVKFNLCNASTQLKIQIGLGLVAQERPKAPACTFSQLKKNWEKALNEGNFLNDFQDMFNPNANDLGIALTLQTNMSEAKTASTTLGQLTRNTSQGWINEGKGIIKKSLNAPGLQGRRLDEISQLNVGAVLKYTGDALTDATNVFVNQLALTAFNNLMGKLGGSSYTSSYDWDKLTNAFAGPDATIGGGITATRNQVRKVMEPKFNVRGDYDILAELVSCPAPTKAGPTNCVIDEKFRQAIEQNKTVGEALADGFLNGDKIFGFSAEGLEPNYRDGYAYRTMIILRTYRILPVGWEIAAQYINDNQLAGKKNLNDLVSCFDSSNPADTWCHGLVDPNWVLKAPLNYCSREGAGPELLSTDKSIVARNDKYCADNRSCIKEKKDGSCEFYGYCAEERRKWKFNTDVCEPINNSCQTFKKKDGQTISYLQNTLNSGVCNFYNAGCAAYCTTYDRAAGKFTCSSNSGSKLYFDRDAETCDANAEGCRALIRTKSGLGTNLLVNPDFEFVPTQGGWNTITAVIATSSDSYSGVASLHLKSGASIKTVTAGPADYSINGEAYALSFYSKNCAAADTFMFANQNSPTNFRADSGWQYNQTSHVFNLSGNVFDVAFNISSPDCLIDAVKLEKNSQPSSYSDYGQAGLIHEKLAPAYLGCDGVDDPDECQNFARQCSVDEVGCELYTPTDGGMSVPGKVTANDYCTSECVGFDTYFQSETRFDSLRPEYFIPNTAQICSAQEVGCDQFTNLDEVARGGEGVEYYSSLRQCVKAGDLGCADFYAWEGSSESGYQLKVVTLKKGSVATEPAITEDATAESLKCNATIYNLNPSDPAYNSDCREFYDANGNKSYHLFSNTINCSDDCHPYRRTELNTDPKLTDAASCGNAGGSWDAANNECIHCKNGGTLSDDKKACIYMAIPGQGSVCSAAAAGCREYTGNSGQNVKVTLVNDFEDGAQSWDWATVGGMASYSPESLRLGGHSLSVSGGTYAIAYNIGSLMKANHSYTINFIAKSSTDQQLNVYVHKALSKNGNIVSSAGVVGRFDDANLRAGSWSLQKSGLAVIPALMEGDELLIIDGSSPFFIDEIKLTEVTDRYYLVKNSWQTPDSCNQDREGNPYPLFMLGCSEYKDRDNQAQYLKSFTRLCSDSSVGCELMIDTYNSSGPASQTYDPDAAVTGDEITTPADSYIYAVYDKNKQCNQTDKGCQLLGKEKRYGSEVLYSETYLKNAPDQYNKSVCSVDSLTCGEYVAETGPKYFKDPGDMVCEWRKGDKQVGEGWYRKKVNRCDGTGNLCLSDGDCDEGKACKEETADILCETDVNKTPKTLGTGGSKVAQPDRDADGHNWVGLCPTDESSCTELIDPVSGFSTNLIFNSDFSQNINTSDTPNLPDGWLANKQEDIKIEANTVYRLAGQDAAPGNSVAVDCAAYVLDSATNKLTGGVGSLSLESAQKSLLFYSGNNTVCNISLTAARTGARVELKKAVIDYQISKELDSGSCSGLVNSDDGCVLFNERSAYAGSFKKSDYNADATIGVRDVPPAKVNDSTADSNNVYKVTPDRECDKWLACKTSVVLKNQNNEDQNVCLDVGLCNKFDYKGSCTNFIEKSKANQTYGSVDVNFGTVSNMSGFSKVGHAPNDYYPLASMEQVGGSAFIKNGDFEQSGSNGYPNNWRGYDNISLKPATWNENMFKIVSGVAEIQDEGLDMPKEGSGIMKMGVRNYALSSTFNLNGNAPEYVAQVKLNTTRLKGGNAKVEFQCVSSGSTLKELYLEPGQNWKTLVYPFSIVGCYQLQVKMYAEQGASGNFYVDDLYLRPALKYRTNNSAAWYAEQSCRLYPKSDSLSCKYVDSSGVQNNGWWGYCLEHDRYPGSPNACLMWWPVEKINGDSFSDENSFKGYSGKLPVYYCSELDGNFRYVEKRQAALYKTQTEEKLCILGEVGNFFLNIGGIIFTAGLPNIFTDFNPLGLGESSTYSGGCPSGAGYIVQSYKKGCGCGFFESSCDEHYYFYCLPSSKKYTVANESNNEWGDGAWYQYNGSLIRYKDASNGWKESEIKAGVKILDLDTNELVNPKDYDYLSCKTFYQTVSESGENKAWLGRLGSDSNYMPMNLGYEYSQDSSPYGSAIPPEPQGNPYEWDGNTKTGNQPVSFKLPQSNEVRAGSPYKCFGGKCHKVGHCKASGKTCIDLSCSTDALDKSCANPAQVNSGSYSSQNECYKANTPQEQTVNTYSTSCTKSTTDSTDCTPADTACPCNKVDGSIVCKTAAGANCVPNDANCANCAQRVSGTATTTVVKVGEASLNCQWTPIRHSDTGAGSTGQTASDDVKDWFPDEYNCGAGDVCVTTASSDWPTPSTNVAENVAVSPLDNLKRMFAKNYGTWKWATSTRKYEKDTSGAQDWDIASAPLCDSDNNGTPDGGPRPVYNPAIGTDDYCKVLPRVTKVKLDKTTINGSGIVKLTFNTSVDVNQLPLTNYTIDWGDKTSKTVISGEFADRPNAADPHVLYHYYNFASAGCANNSCTLSPKVKIADNWGVVSAEASGDSVEVKVK